MQRYFYTLVWIGIALLALCSAISLFVAGTIRSVIFGLLQLVFALYCAMVARNEWEGGRSDGSPVHKVDGREDEGDPPRLHPPE
jgi:hypothetical protein